jgi:hypothetical protein
MKRLAMLLGTLGALSAGCGNGDNVAPAGATDSGPDSTVEGGGTEAGPDSTVDSPSGISASDAGDAGDAGTTTEGSSDASDGGGPSCTPFDAGTLDDAAVSAGLAFILSTGHCNRCHQSNQDAGIVLSGNNNSITDAGPVFPPNLTPDPATGLGCWTNDQIASAILFGNDPATDGGKLCHFMPTFGIPKGDAAALLDDGSVGNVVEALRSLTPVSNLVPTTMCPGSSPSPSLDGGDAGTDASDAAGE